MSRKRILIADDDLDLARALALRCEGLGLHTRVAHDAMTALNLAHADVPDVICLDVNMPGGNGLSAGEMIAHSEPLAGIPVIILTGCHDEETIRRCHNMCAYYVLKCPNVWKRVEPLLHELLGPHLDERPEADTRRGPARSDSPSESDTTPLPELYREMARDVAYAQLDEPPALSN